MSTARDLSTAQWRKSSYSNGDGGNCIEVADGFTSVQPVRDSKNPDGPTLLFPHPAWSAFITAIKSGDLPLTP
ncbi:DUF397 domain-containing protein [Actinacidiphila bryophytorum]|uniref:DUF397 domain-containing protein n=1 Tax=Actinacidiphila bryophytorum TaxID=1436133 RepID=UPI002176BE90|nr:DUF397 domain-containing protein [Actinacidiphila bryophytorum]UWE07615.1 DUF397 domain-containing protein [Actinacidiphila bryophytorum]